MIQITELTFSSGNLGKYIPEKISVFNPSHQTIVGVEVLSGNFTRDDTSSVANFLKNLKFRVKIIDLHSGIAFCLL